MPRKKPAPYEMRVVTAFTNSPVVNDADEPQPSEKARWIALDQITPSAHQPRRYFDPGKMEQLIASVKKKGILEPLLVRPLAESSYELVAGERRLRAAVAVGLETVPCVVYDLSNQEAAEIALLENLQREDLNPVEETEGILDLLAMRLDCSRDEVIAYFGVLAHPEREGQEERLKSPELQTIEEVFTLLGRFTPNSFRTNRLPLLKLPQDILTAIGQSQLEYSKARLLGRVQDEAMRSELLQSAITEQLTREELQQRVRAMQPSLGQSANTEAEVEVVARLKTVYQKAKQPKQWSNAKKRKKLERLLGELEKLLAE